LQVATRNSRTKFGFRVFRVRVSGYGFFCPGLPVGRHEGRTDATGSSSTPAVLAEGGEAAVPPTLADPTTRREKVRSVSAPPLAPTAPTAASSHGAGRLPKRALTDTSPLALSSSSLSLFGVLIWLILQCIRARQDGEGCGPRGKGGASTSQALVSSTPTELLVDVAPTSPGAGVLSSLVA
jgi:hypothetical protein